MQGLAGVRVLELGHLVSAAYATKLIADLGAEVIRIESQVRPDLGRRLGADTDSVMGDLLGYSAQEIARLKEEQVLY